MNERKIPNLRWLIIGMLFISTVINYIDRQTLSILARTIQDDLGMSDISYARIVQAFLLAYTVTFIFAGRFTDWLGTRVSLAVFITWWSIANMLTAFSRSAFSLGAFRFLLGMGEPGNYTAAPKAVSEWFPAKERGLAVGIYTTGATVGATVAPPIIALLATSYGWRSTFVFTGLLGLIWVLPWLWLYHPPHKHSRITDQELALIDADRGSETSAAGAVADASKEGEAKRWAGLLRRRETWLLLAEPRADRPRVVLLPLLVSEIPFGRPWALTGRSGKAGVGRLSRCRPRQHHRGLGIGRDDQARRKYPSGS